ncbi:Crp/Fnr family transcriptional regulator [Parabacteroides sp. PF5-9]|uniref:Crp/Fnr family transcriptional regulator n=1 Tax=Parabacteroides sp. PF5-9 TaxID=1742404 RepID=UPI0024743D39|nr:Crp/Fnr family transcriptional regulator [Parabacteroides sp. PF5-9]MDH6358373.1 CRP-like cAMP-binding protein [Parabacteroides sp. PF5-9]
MEAITCTKEHEQRLFQIPLFSDLPQNVQLSLLDKLDYDLYQIEKNEIILRQNTPCKHLYILLEGKLRVDIIDALGNEVLIEYIVAPRAFATPHLFKTDGTLPATFTVMEEGLFFKATKESVFALISEHPDILKNFLCITGNCTKCTVVRLRALSHKNVRNRFVVYLFEQKKADNNTVQIEHNQVQLADYLCVTRPALSKEINKLAKEGLISIKGKQVELLDVAALKRFIL